MAPTTSTTTNDEQVVVLNPVSGTGDHAEEVRNRAQDRGYTLRVTEEEGDAIEMARAAADDGASVVAAAGGDGTINGVIRGLVAADALDRVTLGVVPCGTGNDFASNVGIDGIGDAFEQIADGRTRRIDLGMAGDRPFVNSCVSGPTAEASAKTDPEQKSQYGSVAYVLNTLRTLPASCDSRVDVDLRDDDGATVWDGSAMAVLVGNARRFPPGGSEQADVEDGRFAVTIVHDVGSIDLVGSAAVERLLGRDTSRTTRYEVPEVEIDVTSADPISFSLDGEIHECEGLGLRTRPAALEVAVGDDYDPDPETE